MEWDAIARRLNTNSQNLWSPKATNSKENSNDLADLHTKVNKLTTQVGAHAPGSGCECFTCGWDHVQSNCPRKPAMGKI